MGQDKLMNRYCIARMIMMQFGAWVYYGPRG